MTNLPPIRSYNCEGNIDEINPRKYNTSALIITHDVDCARVISNRMILLVDGINYAEGTLMNYRLQQIQKCFL
jgi:ABC-type transporter Mla maintaining outer membrane lipid asymmetry ATPase subunit MlaF